MSLDDDARAELQRLEERHRLREPHVLSRTQGPRVVLDGDRVVNFSSNDYLALAGDRRLVRAAANALEECGLGAGASRLIIGNHERHIALERALGDWLRCTGVRLFNSGYAANIGVLTTLVGAGDVVFSDELNHASIVDGCRLSRAKIVVFPHRDVSALERALGEHAGRRRLVISETLFSMDGDVADVDVLSVLCRRHDAILVLDEAHAIGVAGPEGRGVAAAQNIVPDVLIGTCGKALGGCGAFAATTDAIAKLLWNRARTFVFTTALPPMLASSVEAAIHIVRGAEGDDLRHRLEANARELRASVRVGGAAMSPIAPLVLGGDSAVMAASARLLEQGFFVPGIRPPTVPEGTGRLRISLSAGHQLEEVEALADAVRRFT